MDPETYAKLSANDLPSPAPHDCAFRPERRNGHCVLRRWAHYGDHKPAVDDIETRSAPATLAVDAQGSTETR